MTPDLFGQVWSTFEGILIFILCVWFCGHASKHARSYKMQYPHTMTAQRLCEHRTPKALLPLLPMMVMLRQKSNRRRSTAIAWLLRWALSPLSKRDSVQTSPSFSLLSLPSFTRSPFFPFLSFSLPLALSYQCHCTTCALACCSVNVRCYRRRHIASKMHFENASGDTRRWLEILYTSRRPANRFRIYCLMSLTLVWLCVCTYMCFVLWWWDLIHGDYVLHAYMFACACVWFVFLCA